MRRRVERTQVVVSKRNPELEHAKEQGQTLLSLYLGDLVKPARVNHSTGHTRDHNESPQCVIVLYMLHYRRGVRVKPIARCPVS